MGIVSGDSWLSEGSVGISSDTEIGSMWSIIGSLSFVDMLEGRKVHGFWERLLATTVNQVVVQH
jgi:hypothetical protein